MPTVEPSSERRSPRSSTTIFSAESPINFKDEIWNLFATDWALELNKYSKVISLDQIEDEITKILKGQQVGRVVVKHGV